MKLIDMKCPACCAHLNIREGTRVVRCEYCDSKFALEDAEILGSFEVDDDDEQDPSSSMPIAEYAAKQCAQWLEDHADSKKLFSCAPNILRGLEIDDSETVYLIHDDTLLNSGKDGFAITERGLYCRPMLEDAVFYSWDKFRKMAAPEIEDSYIVCKGRRICYISRDGVRGDLLDLYESLQRHARIAE